MKFDFQIHALYSVYISYGGDVTGSPPCTNGTGVESTQTSTRWILYLAAHVGGCDLGKMDIRNATKAR